MAEIAGLDFAWTKPDAGALVRDGFKFVLGYMSGDPSKNLIRPEIDAYRKAGLMVGLVWETAANRVLGGTVAGAADGAAAEAQANSAGYPTNSVIFFAVDYAAESADFGTISLYAHAFNAATRRPVGIYGSFDVVEHFVTPGQHPIQYGWQTGAWSSGKLSGKASIYQRNQASGHWPVLSGTDEDVLCRTLPLMGAGAPVPAPTPPRPTPAPAPAFNVRNWRVAVGSHDAHLPALWAWGNSHYPAYCHITPVKPPVYGPATTAFIREFAHRSGIPSADGTNIGPQVASALAKAGFRG